MKKSNHCEIAFRREPHKNEVRNIFFRVNGDTRYVVENDKKLNVEKKNIRKYLFRIYIK